MDNKEDMMVAIAKGAMDLELIALVAKRGGTISQPKLVRVRKISYAQAEAWLANLAEKHLLQLLPEKRLVPVYCLTCVAYAILEDHRNRRGKLGRFFAHRLKSELRKRLCNIDSDLAFATAELSTASLDAPKAKGAINRARDKILDLVRITAEADQI